MSTPTIENDDQNKENNLFYLVKDVSKDSVGLKDSEGNPIAFFDEKDKGVVQSTALLQKLNNLEFALGSSGSVNSSWYSFLQAGTHTYEDTTGWNPSTFIINWITTTTATDDIGKCRELEVSWATSILNSWEATASKRQGRGTATATFGEIFFLTIKNQLLVANSSLSSLTDSSALKVHIEGILSGANDHSTLPGSAGRSTIPIKEYFKYFNISDGTKFETPGELSDFITIINSIYGDTLSDQLDVQRNNLSSFQSISQSVLSFQSNTEFSLGPYIKGEDRITGYQNIETEEVVSELPEGSDVTDYNLLYGNFSVIDELKDRYSKYSDFANVQTVISGVMLNNQLIESKDFKSLIDTPTGYLGHSGDYLIVNDNESGIHFTGIEKIAQDLTDYGFGGGSLDIPKYTNLPDPTENDGKIVASGCDLYYGCNGEWKKIGSDSIPPPENTPGCVSNLEEYNQYQEYKDEIIEKFQPDAVEKALDGLSFDFFLSDVCLFKEVSNEKGESLCETKVIESNYKWAIVESGSTINIKAQAQAKTSETFDLAVQSDTSDGSVNFIDLGSYQHTLIPDGDVKHSSSVTKYGSTSLYFNGGFLDTENIGPFNFMHTDTEYSLGFWVNGEISANHDGYIISTSSFSSSIGFRCAFIDERIFFSINGTNGIGISSRVLDDFEWYYVKITQTVAGTNLFKLSMYVNGELHVESNKSSSPYDSQVNSQFPLSIGRNRITGRNLSNIYLQDLVIFKGNLDPATFTDVPTTLTPVSVNPDEEVNCSFVNWKTSDNSIIGDVNSSETTVLINNDVSITGVFQC